MPPPSKRPQVSDLLVWQQQLLEHRRSLLEIVVREFPQVMKTHRTAVDLLRLKIQHAVNPKMK
jgi:hypothetical protein